MSKRTFRRVGKVILSAFIILIVGFSIAWLSGYGFFTIHAPNGDHAYDGCLLFHNADFSHYFDGGDFIYCYAENGKTS